MPDAASWGRPSPWWLAWAVIAATVLATLSGWCGRWWWFLELFSHFQVQYLVVDALILAVFAIGRRWRGVVWSILLLVVHAAAILPLFIRESYPGSAPASELPSGVAGSRPLRVLFLNVEQINASYSRVLELVREQDPDIAAFVEVDQQWLRGLMPLIARYPNLCAHPRSDAFGVAVFGRVPWVDEVVFAGGDHPTAVVRLHGLTVIATHPVPPLGSEWASRRDRQLASLASLAAGETQAVMLCGDLNCSGWSPRFSDLLRDGRLHDSRRGHGVQASWPTFFAPLGIPIDHCLVSDGVHIDMRELGPQVGSDHRPLLIEAWY